MAVRPVLAAVVLPAVVLLLVMEDAAGGPAPQWRPDLGSATTSTMTVAPLDNSPVIPVTPAVNVPVTSVGSSSPGDGTGSVGTTPADVTTAASAASSPSPSLSPSAAGTSAAPSASADDDAFSNEVTPGETGAVPELPPPQVEEGSASPAAEVPDIEQREEDTNDVTSPCVPGLCGPNQICVPNTSKRPECLCVDGTEMLGAADGRGRGQCVRTTRQPVLPCNLQCGEHGNCRHDSRGRPQCLCTSPLYTGVQCERDRCAGYCANKGHCYRNLIKSAELACNCLVGWIGERCETAVNPCSDGAGCMNGGTCSRASGADACECPHGFTGRLCEQCQDHECHGNNSTCLRDPVTTVPTCQCAPGLSGEHCETGNCTTQPCHHGTCTMKKGEPKCTCDPGYGGPTCDDDLCLMHCKNGGTCARMPSGVECYCGIRHGGRRCEVDLCACTPDCQSDDCISCPPGISQQDNLCGRVLRMSCADGSLLCLNGGTCQDTDEQALCRCKTGYSGAHCEVGPDGGGACRLGLCLHGGSCEETTAGGVCHCLTGWIGERCQQPESCRHYCFNGATCELAPAAAGKKIPTCHCAPGSVGLRCASREPGSLAGGAASVDSPGSVATGAAVTVALVLLALAVVALVVWRKRNGKPFSHTRMRGDKLEVDNPMYLRDLEARSEAEEGEEVEDAVFSLEEKPTNFSNPVYESTYPERDGAAASSEKTNLLPPENGRPSLTFAGTAPTDPLHDDADA